MSATLAEVLIEADGSRTGQVRVKSRSANWHRRLHLQKLTPE
jgi:hypothetical protein